MFITPDAGGTRGVRRGLDGLARGRFLETRLMDVVIKQPAMEELDAAILAALCGDRAERLF